MIVQKLIRSSLLISLIYTVHYSLVRVYVWFCVPTGFIGFLQGILTSGGPFCSGVLYIINNTNALYSTLLLSCAAILYSIIRSLV